MLVEILLGLLFVLTSIYFYSTRYYGYWKKKGVVYIKPIFPLGTFHEQFLGRKDAGTVIQEIYTKYKAQGHKFVGAFFIQQPTLYILDLDLAKNILVKDFHHWVNRNLTPVTHEFITQHLFALEGPKWKEMRVKLTPTFTSGKMKNMFALMGKCAEQLQEHIDDDILKEGGEFEVKDLIARFTTDIIGTCAFGLEVNSVKNKDDEFFQIGQLIFVPSISTMFKVLLSKAFPSLTRFLKISLFNTKVPQFMSTVIKDTVHYRKQNKIIRNDFVDLLMSVGDPRLLEDDGIDKNSTNHKSSFLNSLRGEKNGESHNSSKASNGLTIEEMIAQAFVFFAAGFETAASTTSFCLYELAKNKDVQRKLQAEIDEVLANHDGQITYQALQDMTYMDQVMNETLRLYASLPLLTRVCTERYRIPGTDIVIDEGVRANIPSYAIHHDPDIYPEPFKFDPERFSEENSKGRHQYAFIPFGEGPRICIGMRFAKLQVKVGLAAILSRYELSPAADTPSHLEIHPLLVFTTPRHPFKLVLSKREDFQ